MSLRVRVKVDGDSIHGTRLYDADTGKELDTRRISRVEVEHRLGTLPRIRVTFLGDEVDVVGRLETADQETARAYLERLGRAHHPSAERDPVGALGQAAVDLKQALLLARYDTGKPTL